MDFPSRKSSKLKVSGPGSGMPGTAVSCVMSVPSVVRVVGSSAADLDQSVRGLTLGVEGRLELERGGRVVDDVRVTGEKLEDGDPVGVDGDRVADRVPRDPLHQVARAERLLEELHHIVVDQLVDLVRVAIQKDVELALVVFAVGVATFESSQRPRVSSVSRSGPAERDVGRQRAGDVDPRVVGRRSGGRGLRTRRRTLPRTPRWSDRSRRPTRW